MEIKINDYQMLEIRRNGPDCIVTIEEMRFSMSLEKLEELLRKLGDWKFNAVMECANNRE